MSSEPVPAAPVLPLAKPGEPERLGSRVAPTQFRILDLFAAISLAAVVFAILVPVLPRFSIENLLAGVAAVGVQLASATATFMALAVRRKRMLQRAGYQVGIAFSGESSWKHWPIVRCCLVIAGAGLLQFAVSLLFVFGVLTTFSPILLLYSIQLGYFFGASISQLHWRSYPGVIEFYENGITLDGRTLTPWNRIRIRNSTVYPNRIVLVSDATNVPGARATHTAQVTNALRRQLHTFLANKGSLTT